MSASDHQFKRLTDRLEKLDLEQQELNRRLLQTRRDEQFDLDHIRRRYAASLHRLEQRLSEIAKENQRYERELDNLKRRREKEAEQEAQEKNTASQATVRRFRI